MRGRDGREPPFSSSSPRPEKFGERGDAASPFREPPGPASAQCSAAGTLLPGETLYGSAFEPAGGKSFSQLASRQEPAKASQMTTANTFSCPEILADEQNPANKAIRSEHQQLICL
ncbi:uncharacterized protein LOC132709668 isoform X4 [Pantherophis guttatus]|uniref:Uncharacterized protein LOC132709668 isoform X4 n=1 Tax=Pantherophis guttatus TaxID=94885 RepID=A0ABM3YV35_PANGU|nr:uncharacterized protein LOC132709668 isoform X4 [Pantherophis guttatus]